MKNKTKLIIGIMLISILSISMLVLACTPEEGQSNSLPKAEVKVDPNKPGWEQDDRAVTLDWYINFPWYTGSWGQDAVTQHITELTGVDVNFIIPAGNPNEKLNTLIVSDSLPDLITIGWWEDIAKSLQDPKFTYNLEELADAYDPYFLKITDQGRRDWYRKEDGGVYGYPNASYSPSDYENKESIFSNDTFLVRKDLYESIGSPNMSTPEGFLQALRDAKDKFAKVDGQVLVPIGFTSFEGGTSTLGKYLQNFLAIPDVKDNKLYDRDTDPEYIKWLKVFRQANEEGLISRDVFSDTRQQIEEKLTQGRYFAILYPYIDAIWPLTSRYNDDPSSTYIPIDGPKNSNGDEHELNGPGISGWTLTMISKKNKNPEKTIRFLGFLFSEKGKEVAFLGKKGVTWDMIDGKASFYPEIDTMRADNRAEFDKQYGADWLLWMGMDTAFQFKKWPIPAPEAYNAHRQWTVGKTKARFELENIDPLGNSDIGIALGKITNQFSEILPKMILAESEAEFDELLNDYIEFRDNNQFQESMDYRTDKMLENKKKLGL